MSLLSLLLKLRYGSYENSKRASAYEKVADVFRVSPQHVYEIAHGKKVWSREDNDIFQELIAMGIIVYK